MVAIPRPQNWTAAVSMKCLWVDGAAAAAAAAAIKTVDTLSRVC